MITLEQYLNTLAIAMTCASFFAVFSSSKKAKICVSIIAIVSSMVISYYVYSDNNEKKKIAIEEKRNIIENAKLWTIEHAKEYSTFDDIFHNSYYQDYATSEIAIDELVGSKILDHQKVTIKYKNKDHIIALYKIIK